MATYRRSAQVIRYGVDTGGDPVYMTRRMRAWFIRLRRETGLDLKIAQGAWMKQYGGGGAKASAGYHDFGGCLDISLLNLDAHERQVLLRAARRGGAAAWIRDKKHGNMPLHLHLVLACDYQISQGGKWQIEEYKAGRDGLASQGKDYHWRPKPLVLWPPKTFGRRFRRNP